jgi:hypothetical protein
LRLSELHQALVSLNFGWGRFLRGIAAIPDAVPFGIIVQLPFALAAHHSSLVLRLPSIFSAIANCYLMWQLARHTPIRSPLAGTIVFMFLPIHFLMACDSRPYELALLFLLLATIRFFRIIQEPDNRNVAIYAALLTLCIYTEPISYLPAIGYVLFLLRFSGRPAERRALWYILPATALPALLYLPYYAWANPQRNTKLLSVKQPFSDADLLSQTLHSLAPGRQLTEAGAVLFVLLIIGLCAGMWSSFPPFLWPLKMRITLFCLAGGAVIPLLFAIGYAAGYNVALTAQQLLFASPGMVILSFAALDWLIKSKPELKSLTYSSAASLMVVLCAPAIFDFISSPGPNIADLVQAAKENLTSNSCIVFVSEGESPYFFLLYDPTIWDHECRNFFAKRIILASHPWVRPDQQRDAEMVFRGLNFVETRRIRVADSLVIVEDTN